MQGKMIEMEIVSYILWMVHEKPEKMAKFENNKITK